jgi:RNA polymerase sigma-70 factor (ECF subfamily)
MDALAPDSAETQRLLDRLAAGDVQVRDRLLERHRRYLSRLVEVRLDPRLRARIDPSDVVQEAQLEASRRLARYVKDRPLPFRLWLRQIANDRLLMLRRRHVGAKGRTVEREEGLPDHSSLLLAREFLAAGPTPSERLEQKEFSQRVRQALGQLAQADRDILVLRKLEELSNLEAAQILGIDPATASRRFGRAVIRLREVLVKNGLMESSR